MKTTREKQQEVKDMKDNVQNNFVMRVKEKLDQKKHDGGFIIKTLPEGRTDFYQSFEVFQQFVMINKDLYKDDEEFEIYKPDMSLL